MKHFLFTRWLLPWNTLWPEWVTSSFCSWLGRRLTTKTFPIMSEQLRYNLDNEFIMASDVHKVLLCENLIGKAIQSCKILICQVQESNIKKSMKKSSLQKWSKGKFWVRVNCSKCNCSNLDCSTLFLGISTARQKNVICSTEKSMPYVFHVSAVDTQFFATVKYKSSIFFI